MQAGRFRTISEGLTLRAGHFIVTLYGDVVEPRGGRLWMGNIIETCASVGISETLVRTAVSRLVAAGKLKGQRLGRRSFYALTPAVKAEFAQAARILFDPPQREGWMLVQAAAELAPPFVKLGEGWWLGADEAVPAGAGVVFRASLAQGAEEFSGVAQALFSLQPLGEAYDAFHARFGPLEAALAAEPAPAPAEALMLRLLLVDRFRAIVLKDPLLPAEALPGDWAGVQARALFARLYIRLSPLADAHVARCFVSADGALPSESKATLRRVRTLGYRA